MNDMTLYFFLGPALLLLIAFLSYIYMLSGLNSDKHVVKIKRTLLYWCRQNMTSRCLLNNG